MPPLMPYVAVADGVALYRADGHLSTAGAKRMGLPLLREAFPDGKEAPK